ncbi:nnp-1 protein putative nuclear protein 1 nop52 [Anaeramoeba flamelloides]|uniref:Nnp-1 protein putative nuclear protein 1 nop52 n=1 Tax=Anaeramoeba flamelloides TaxID=1746091 RepID=A0AAV8ACK9_9EUKA|nr:nnp-1 protein putative nuclear protein 1 nop52 [Anaeramoeba flamelloides]
MSNSNSLNNRLKVISWIRKVLKKKIPLKCSPEELFDHSCSVLSQIYPEYELKQQGDEQERIKDFIEGCTNFGIDANELLILNQKIDNKSLISIIKKLAILSENKGIEPYYSKAIPIKLKNNGKSNKIRIQKRKLREQMSQSLVIENKLFLTPMNKNDRRRFDTLIISPFFTVKNRGKNEEYENDSIITEDVPKDIQLIQEYFINQQIKFIVGNPQDSQKVELFFKVFNLEIIFENGKQHIFPFNNIPQSKVRFSKKNDDVFQLVIIEDLGNNEPEEENGENNDKHNGNDKKGEKNQQEYKFLFQTNSENEKNIISKTFQMYQYYNGNCPELKSLNGKILGFKNEEMTISKRCLTNGKATFPIKLFNQKEKKIINSILQIHLEYFLIQPIEKKNDYESDTPYTFYWGEENIDVIISKKNKEIFKIIIGSKKLDQKILKIQSIDFNQRAMIKRCFELFQTEFNKGFSFIELNDTGNKKKSLNKNQKPNRNKSKKKKKKKKQKEMVEGRRGRKRGGSDRKEIDFLQELELPKTENQMQSTYFAIFNREGNSKFLNLQINNPFFNENSMNSIFLDYTKNKFNKYNWINKKLKQLLQTNEIIFNIRIISLLSTGKNKKGNVNNNKTQQQINNIEIDLIFLKNKIIISKTKSNNQINHKTNKRKKEEKVKNDNVEKMEILNQNYSNYQKVFSHSKQLNKMLFIDTEGNKYIFLCKNILEKDLIINIFFNMRKRFLNPKRDQEITNNIMFITPKNDKGQKMDINIYNNDGGNYKNNGNSSNRNNKQNENNNNTNNENNNEREKKMFSNYKYNIKKINYNSSVQYDIQLFNSLEEYMGNAEIFLFKEFFVFKYLNLKIARYYSPYSKLLIYNKKNLYCRLNLDENQYINFTFSNKKILNYFLKTFKIRCQKQLTNKISSPSVFNGIMLKSDRETINISIVLSYDHFLIKSNLEILKCFYLLGSHSVISENHKDIAKIIFLNNYPTMKILFPSSIVCKQFVKSFNVNNYKWISNSFENTIYATKAIINNNLTNVILTDNQLILIDQSYNELSNIHYFNATNSRFLVMPFNSNDSDIIDDNNNNNIDKSSNIPNKKNENNNNNNKINNNKKKKINTNKKKN